MLTFESTAIEGCYGLLVKGLVGWKDDSVRVTTHILVMFGFWVGRGRVGQNQNNDARRFDRQTSAHDISANTHRQKSSSIPIES